MKSITKNTQNELHATRLGVASQCSITDTIFIVFKGNEWAFRAKDFLVFRKRANAANLKELLFNLSDFSDTTTVDFPKHAINISLTLCELVQLRELLDGTMFALNLYSMLQETLGEVVFEG